RPERGTLSDRIALEIGTIAEFCELAVRRAYFRAFEIIHVEIGQQMQPGLEGDNFDRGAAVVSDEPLGPRDHQQVEWIVVGAALAGGELRRLRRGPAPKRVPAQPPARSRIRIAAIAGAPI